MLRISANSSSALYCVANLQPFTLRETVEYMESRLEKAGLPEQIGVFRGNDG